MDLFRYINSQSFNKNAIKCGNWLTDYCIDKNNYVSQFMRFQKINFMNQTKSGQPLLVVTIQK